MNAKISLCVLLLLYAYSENAGKVFKRTANLGLFAVHKIVSEYAERIYAYMEKTPRATKLCISWLIIIRI
jgi:hypothetical protein